MSGATDMVGSLELAGRRSYGPVYVRLQWTFQELVTFKCFILYIYW